MTIDWPPQDGRIAALYADAQGALYRYIYRFIYPMGDRQDAENLLHDTFVRIQEGRGAVPEGAGAHPWLYRTAHNLCCNFIKRRRLEAARHVRLFTESDGRVRDERLHALADAGGLADAVATIDAVHRALATLPPAERVMLLLHHADGWGHAEIARLYRDRRGRPLSVSAVKMRVLRARRAFVRAYAEDLDALAIGRIPCRAGAVCADRMSGLGYALALYSAFARLWPGVSSTEDGAQALHTVVRAAVDDGPWRGRRRPEAGGRDAKPSPLVGVPDEVVRWIEEGARRAGAGCAAAAREAYAQALAHTLHTLHSLGWSGIMEDSGDLQRAYLQAVMCAPGDVGAAWRALGDAYRDLHLVSAPIAAYERALRYAPERAETWCALGRAYRPFGVQAPAARAAFERAVACAPQYTAAWVEIGQIHRFHERWAEARAAFEQAICGDPPPETETWDELGDMCMELGDWSAAVDAYRVAVQRDPADDAAGRGLGDAFWSLGRWDDALEAYRGVLAHYPEDWEVWEDVGALALKLGRLSEAGAAFRTALEGDPEDVVRWHGLGSVCARQGRRVEAVEAYRRMLAGTRYHRATWEDNDAVLRGDVAVFEEMLRQQPQEATLLCRLGEAHRRLGCWAEALAAYEAVLARNPRQSEAWHGVGTVHVKTGDLSGAVRAYRRALAAEPLAVTVWQVLEAVLHEEVERCEALCAGQADDAQAWASLGDARMRQGDAMQAISAYKQAVALDPGDATAWYALGDAYTRHIGERYARFGVGYGDLLKAQRAYIRALRLSPGEDAGWPELGDSLLQDVVVYREVVHHDPGNAAAWRNLGDAYRRQGQDERAMSAYRAAREAAGRSGSP